MSILYFIAIIPVIIGGILWALSKEVNWVEWLSGSVAAIALAGIFHTIGVYSIPSDIQTFSGQITKARHFTRWQEYYEEAVYRTETYYTGTGKKKERHTKQVFDHWRGCKRWHDDDWKFYSNINTDYNVNAAEYTRTVRLFGEERSIEGDRTTSEHASKMIAGDPNDRISTPISGYIYPITDKRTWENKIKVGPSVYSFIEVPKTVPVFDWPANPDPFVSQRLLGTAAQDMPIYDWDRLNAQLGPAKRVNLIAIGFGDKDSEIAQYQRAKYVGGKKNDLVICYGGEAKTPSWVVVFGWTDKELVKQNLQTLILEHGFIKENLQAIRDEIISNYKIKNWHEFDYISVPPTTGLIVWYVISMIVVQGGLYYWFNKNEFSARPLTRAKNPILWS